MELLKRMAALQKQVEWLTEELASTNRRLENIIRLGTVAQANADTVDVQTGANLAKGAPFFVPAAGRVKHYRRPSVGEQCILINLGSGDNLNNAVALMGLRSNLYPFPTLKENEVMTDYGGGMKEVYDLDAGSMTCDYPGGMFLTADLTHIGNQEHTGNTNRTGDSIFTGSFINTGMFNHQGAFAVSGGVGGGAAIFEGGMNITNGDVVVDGYSVKLHFHYDDENRPTSQAMMS
ncbi:phage baseplate assembly protein V [Vibrio cholerae]|uniref:phage baseplate assembly protein V n=1 Tax=Vibrio sp. bablab_jr001 TaxID=2755067 RepID=UPI001FD203B5|nr:phage baseplate assembly protein V [Vibrio sp. bablab_jr001]